MNESDEWANFMAMMKSAPGSRLPVRQQQQPNMPVERGVSAPSKLELLREQYQQQMQKAKEDKLREMYFHNPPPSNRALLRITSNTEDQDRDGGGGGGGGNVRDFFQQRRTIEQQRGNNTYTKNTGYLDAHKHRNGRPPPVPSTYKGQGRDKSKPLAPISRDNSSLSSPAGLSNTYTLDKDGKPVPFNKKAVRTRGNPKHKGATDGEQMPRQDLNSGRSDRTSDRPAAAPTSAQKNKSKKFQEWRDEQKRKKESMEERAAMERGDSASHKLSDYEKWQQSMDDEKSDRLAQHRQQQQPASVKESKKAAILHQQNAKHIEIAVDDSDDEGDEDDERLTSEARRQEEMVRKQEELTRQIEEQQKALDKLRKNRLKEEEQNRRQEEEDRRRKAALAQKQKKIREEEEATRRRREDEEETAMRRREEEQEVKAKRLQEINNNNQKLIAQHAGYQHKDSPSSNRTYSVASDRVDSPPSKYFPTKAVRPRSRKTSVASVQETERHHPKQQQQQQQQQYRYQPKPPPPRPAETSLHDEAENEPPPEDPTSFYVAAAEEAGGAESVRLVPCNNCGRKFAEERLAKHSKVCKDSAKKLSKRKKFDGAKMRVAGTDMAKYAGKAQSNTKPKPKSDWRKKRENFVNTLRYARAAHQVEMTGGNVSDLPPPPKQDTSDYVQCPHCSRKFNAGSAERHIPHCKESKEKEAIRKQNSNKARRR